MYVSVFVSWNGTWIFLNKCFLNICSINLALRLNPAKCFFKKNHPPSFKLS